jgi:hypothetical protein
MKQVYKQKLIIILLLFMIIIVLFFIYYKQLKSIEYFSFKKLYNNIQKQFKRQTKSEPILSFSPEKIHENRKQHLSKNFEDLQTKLQQKGFRQNDIDIDMNFNNSRNYNPYKIKASNPNYTNIKKRKLQYEVNKFNYDYKKSLAKSDLNDLQLKGYTNKTTRFQTIINEFNNLLNELKKLFFKSEFDVRSTKDLKIFEKDLQKSIKNLNKNRDITFEYNTEFLKDWPIINTSPLKFPSNTNLNVNERRYVQFLYESNQQILEQIQTRWFTKNIDQLKINKKLLEQPPTTPIAVEKIVKKTDTTPSASLIDDLDDDFPPPPPPPPLKPPPVKEKSTVSYKMPDKYSGKRGRTLTEQIMASKTQTVTSDKLKKLDLRQQKGKLKKGETKVTDPFDFIKQQQQLQKEILEKGKLKKVGEIKVTDPLDKVRNLNQQKRKLKKVRKTKVTDPLNVKRLQTQIIDKGKIVKEVPVELQLKLKIKKPRLQAKALMDQKRQMTVRKTQQSIKEIEKIIKDNKLNLIFDQDLDKLLFKLREKKIDDEMLKKFLNLPEIAFTRTISNDPVLKNNFLAFKRKDLLDTFRKNNNLSPTAKISPKKLLSYLKSENQLPSTIWKIFKDLNIKMPISPSKVTRPARKPRAVKPRVVKSPDFKKIQDDLEKFEKKISSLPIDKKMDQVDQFLLQKFNNNKTQLYKFKEFQIFDLAKKFDKKFGKK